MFLSGNKNGKIILTINSGACHCVKSRCFNMQKEVKDFISEKGYGPSIELKTYDMISGDEAAKIIEKYQMGMPPYIILLNNNDEIKYKANAFEYNKDALNEAVKALLQESVKK